MLNGMIFIVIFIMADKNSAPAFKMGTSRREELAKGNGVPGPGTYDSINTIKSPLSRSKVSQDKRFGQYDTFTPGPGSYDNKIVHASSIKNSHIPKATILSRHEQKQPEKFPGPGQYNPDYKKSIKMNNGYSLGKSQKLPDDSKGAKEMPGPFNYETSKPSILGLSSGTKFDPAERKLKLFVKPTETPGPAAYTTVSYNGNIKIDPKISFTKSSRSQSMNTLAPAPNTYKIKTDIESGKEKKKGFSLSYRTKQKTEENFEKPGPGAYVTDTLDVFKKSSPSFSIGKSAKLKLEKQSQVKEMPGPDAYNSKVNTFQHQSFSIGKDTRKGIQNVNKNPGPGTYQSKIKNDLPSYSVSKSLRKGLENDNKDQPGPGHYQPKVNFNSQYENIKIGSDYRRTFLENKLGPGPGAYNTETKQTGGWSMGHETRIPKDKSTKDIVPGPGNYTIPSLVSNLPQYATIKQK